MKNKPLTEYRRNLPHIQPKDAAFFITFRLYGSIPLAKLDAMSQKYMHDKNLPTNNHDIKKANQNSQEVYFEALDDNPNGPYYLTNPRIAKLVMEALHFRDEKVYSLICFCIMSNHVHMVIYNLQKPLHIVMKELKSFTGKEAIKILESERPASPLDTQQAPQEPVNEAPASLISSPKAVQDPDSERPRSLIFSQQMLRDPKLKKFWQPESFDRIIRDRNDLDKKIKYTLNNPVKVGLVNRWADWPYSFMAKAYVE